MAAGGITMTNERLALAILIFFILLIGSGGLLAWRTHQDGLTLHARMPEQGGWDPTALSATVGQPLHLRLTSDDVTHSFAVGQMDWPAVDIYPGEMTEVTLTFDHPGKYVYYCTRWCGPNHWRMRGTIEVSGGDAAPAGPVVTQPVPLYVNLNLDIDAPHPASATPQARPSAVTGMSLIRQVPPAYRTTEYLHSHSPAETWQALRGEPPTQSMSDQEVWDLVAALWLAGATPEHLEQGKALYAQNCAACHGENGAGDGVFASQGEDSPSSITNGHDLKPPTDFTDSSLMLGASPALLQGKIVRGGMGTGMPYWGPILTEDQIWAILDYLYTFQFDEK